MLSHGGQSDNEAGEMKMDEATELIVAGRSRALFLAGRFVSGPVEAAAAKEGKLTINIETVRASHFRRPGFRTLLVNVGGERR